MRKVHLVQQEGETIEINLPKSFNRGNPHCSIVDDSIKRLGFSRSIVVDSNNNVISGDKVLAAAVNAGLKKAVVVETNGDEIVIVRRNDVEPNSRKSYELSLVDNLSSTKNIFYDADVILAAMNETLSFDARAWGGHECLVKELDIRDLISDDILSTHETKEKKKVEVITQQTTLFD